MNELCWMTKIKQKTNTCWEKDKMVDKKHYKKYEQKNSKLKSSYHHCLCCFLNQIK